MLGIFPGLNSVTKFTVITKFCKSATKIAKKKKSISFANCAVFARPSQKIVN